MEITKEQITKMEKFDTHSHVGVDARNPVASNIAEYCRASTSKNTKRGILIGVPLPRYQTEDGIYTPVNWETDGMKLNMYSELIRPDGKKIRKPVQQNPFAESNKKLEQEVENASSPDLKLHFVPHVHPLLDTQKHLESVLAQSPIAVKIHGSSWGIDPKDIPRKFFETVNKYNVPLLVHTDYSAGPKNGNHVAIGANDPLVWIDLLERYETRASLAHGLRLCEESWERVGKSGDQFIIGFGPKLTTKGFRVKKRGGDYVIDLMEMADLDKLTYDVDFAWNKDDKDSIDWTLDEELINKMPKERFKDFYKGNAERFYRIKSKE